MFLSTRDAKANELSEFGRPVESIMRCEDFKSNFARRLSNRYIARSPAVNQKHDLLLKPLDKKPEETPDNAPERIELSSQLSKSINMEQTCKAAITPDNTGTKSEQIKATEVTALNREVELLKWQLAQTEGNRQMQIALLKQIVSFLNRVKEHMEDQTKQPEPRKPEPAGLYTGSFNSADLPRSRSVLTVNKNLEYTTAKKLNTRKRSKSISNVNGFTDYSAFLNQSKLSLNQETDSKITEEISRLITLANSVLSTKLPDLTCTCDKAKADSDSPEQDPQSDIFITDRTETQSKNNFNGSLDLIEEAFTLIPDCENSNEPDRTLTNSSPSSTSRLTCGVQDDFIEASIHKPSSPLVVKKTESFNGKACKKEIDFNVGTNFIEDESGFSSMSSFQEIGIPIINIIPPTPCKNAEFTASDFDILDEPEKWTTETIEIDNHVMKVFWV